MVSKISVETLDSANNYYIHHKKSHSIIYALKTIDGVYAYLVLAAEIFEVTVPHLMGAHSTSVSGHLWEYTKS